jgi:TetR/AcrR family transcriptional regulator, cholesterol catabolism regulator
MEIMPRTPRVVEDRREQIIDAAMRVFAQKGFTKSTNKDVAREAGITPGLIYYYFESKEALLKAVLEERSPLHVVSTITPEMLELPPEIFMPMLLKRVLDVVESEQFLSIIRVILPEVLHNPEVAPFLNSFAQRVLGFIESYLRLQIVRGTLRSDLNPDTTIHALIGSMVTLVGRRQFLHDPQVTKYTHEEIAQAVVATILHGIQAR